MQEKRLECLMMLQIHRLTQLLMHLLTDFPPLQHGDNFLVWTWTSVRCTVQ